MQSEEPPISLHLNGPLAATGPAALVPVEQLQFLHAEPADGQPVTKRCASCKLPITSTYYQAIGQDVCPACAQTIQTEQQAPPAHSLLKAVVYGGGAAIAGCALYATLAIVANLELALLAIVIGFMVGKAIRHASNGRGGRPQQILAVLLTYFAITFSYVVVFIHSAMEKPAPAAQSAASRPNQEPAMSAGSLVISLVGIAAIAPFLQLQANVVSGLLSLVIIFFGLRKAWTMTGRTDLLILGPYNVLETS